MDASTLFAYSKESMFQRLTTILLLTAITVQAVFGGLQDTVSICLGGGHEHEVAEVVEHCEMECSHHSEWPTPITNSEDIDDCACTDLELALVTLLTVPRDADETPQTVLAVLPSEVIALPVSESTLRIIDDPPIERQQLHVVRITRLLV